MIIPNRKLFTLLIALFSSIKLISQECSQPFETYVEYKEHLDIYNKPNGNVIQEFRFEDDPEFEFGKNISFKNAEHGWLQIEHIYDDYTLTGKWIKSESVVITTNNYNGSSIPLKQTSNPNSETIVEVKEVTKFNVLNFCNHWIFVCYNNKLGWLAPEYICTNEITNCN